MKKIIFFIGTRPEAIKICPLVLELQKDHCFQTVVCLTGQHKEMLHSVMNIFHIQSDYDLSIMKPGQSLSYLTSSLVKKQTEVLVKEKPDLVLVHGDTTTAMCGALSAFYLAIPVGHVEAGLRTHDITSPFPEELNRRIVDMVSSLFFAPTQMALENLTAEGIKNGIVVTGNTVIDAMKYTIDDNFCSDDLEWAKDSRMILMTCHRRENIGSGMAGIFQAIRSIVESFPDIKVIYPVHPNPLVQEEAKKYLGDCAKIRLVRPLDVISFHNYMRAAYLIITDSGGVQEEAPSLHKPVLVVRKETERPEGVAAGTLRLAGVTYQSVYSSLSELLHDKNEYEKMANSMNPYGDGQACERIHQSIRSYFSLGSML